MNRPPEFGQAHLDYLFTVAYDELRRLAASVREGDGSNTLNPTALVNEAWMRLRSAPELRVESRLHFKRIAARAMRRILVEAARRRNAQKRGGDHVLATMPLDDVRDEDLVSLPRFEDVVTFEQALLELERLDPRQAQIVEGRFYGGLEVQELVELLGVSEATVMRDWRMARAWLAHRMQKGAGDPLP